MGGRKSSVALVKAEHYWYNWGNQECLPCRRQLLWQIRSARKNLLQTRMSNPLATRNEFDPQTPVAPQSVEGARPPKRGPRFTYPSGSQPLEGFTIKRGIGMGGFGEVYFAISDAGKEVAIKRIQRNLDVELRGVRQCLNLKHVNLISLWDIRSNELGESWVVMEYVPGFNLRDKLEQNPTGLPETELKQWFISIASGVNYLHRNGIVHRDLKPGNIFFDTDQQIVKIGDYGLAKFISASKRSGQTESVGTFHYMAPEIGKGIYGKEIDVYALGVILYEMICGQLPFDGESAHEIIMKHLTADVDLRPIPVQYRECIAGSLRKDPVQRFSTVSEMLAKLPWPECDAPLINQLNSIGTPPQPEVVSVNGDQARTPRQQTQRRETTSRTCLYIGDDGVEEFTEIVPNYERTTIHGRNLLDEGIVISGTGKSYVRREPIAKAIQGGWDGAVRWWHRSDISVPFKIGVAIIGSVLLIINSGWLIPVGLIMGLLYFGYYVVRSWVLPDEQTNVFASRTNSEQRKNSEIRQFLLTRSWERRLIDLTGSLLVAVFSCLIFSFIGLTIKGTVWGPQYETAAIYFWLAATSTLASWAILIAGKYWESRPADFWVRLVTMMSCGFVLGIISYMIGAAFFIGEFAPNFASSLDSNLLVPSALISFLLFFTIWFGVSRMAQWVDPTRSARIKLWRVGLAVLFGSILAQTCGLYPPLFVAVTVITSLATQLGAPILSIDEAAIQAPIVSRHSVRG